MARSTSVNSDGIGVVGLLGVAFVILKLCGVIDWSWWWVTAPFWIGPAIAVSIGAVILICLGIAMLFDH